MVYGVDECRICGARMEVSGPLALQRHLASLTKKKPTMSEKEWRAAGFKAAPTLSQLRHPHEGCCNACRLPIALQGSTPRRLITVSVIFLPIAIAFVYFVAWLLV